MASSQTLLLAASLVAGAPAAGGAIDYLTSLRAPYPPEIRQVNPAAFRVIGGDLLALHEEYQRHLRVSVNAPFVSANSAAPVAQGAVTIDVVTDGDGAAVLARLEALGLRDGDSYRHLVSGRLPIGALLELAGVEGIRFARPAYATTHVGSVTGQGVPALRTDLASATFGVDGTGITVGAISDSYNCLLGAGAGVASGDLPSGVTVVQEMSPCTGATDEGRALLEVIHDIAPGASLLFHTGLGGQAVYAQGIQDLVTAGADVIVDDVTYLRELMFQDGALAQSVNDAFGSGVPYISAAGNSAVRSYEGPFRPSGIVPTGLPAGHIAHDFDPGPGVDIYQLVLIPAGPTNLTFQWDSPAASAGGPGSTNDLAFYLYGDPANPPLATFDDLNIGADPIEVTAGISSAVPGLANIVITTTPGGGPDPGFIKYIALKSNVEQLEYFTPSSTIYGHQNTVGAEAIGSANYWDTPAFGQNPPLLDLESSAGGTPILFHPNGSLAAPVILRAKPEVVAPHIVNNTFFGVDIPDPGDNSDLDSFPNFPGTSAAAPHIAAVTALMLESHPGLTPEAVYHAFEATAIDMLVPGFDFDSGYGYADALEAIGYVQDLIFYSGFRTENLCGWSFSVGGPACP